MRQPGDLTIAVADDHATRAAGAALAAAWLKAGRQRSFTVALEGELGAGKTTFVRGFLDCLGHRGPVMSPTFTLLESYRLEAGEVHHLDAFRIEREQDFEDLGVRDLEQPGAVFLIEWASRVAAVAPAADLLVTVHFDDAGRRLDIRALTETGEALRQLAWPEAR